MDEVRHFGCDILRRPDARSGGRPPAQNALPPGTRGLLEEGTGRPRSKTFERELLKSAVLRIEHGW
jgi:hypothetical protein